MLAKSWPSQSLANERRLKAVLPVTRRHRPNDAGVSNPLGAEVHLALLTPRVLTPIHVVGIDRTCFSSARPSELPVPGTYGNVSEQVSGPATPLSLDQYYA